MSHVSKTSSKAVVQKTEPKVIKIQAYSPSELANIYGLKWGVMNQWFKYLHQFTGERIGRYYTPKQVAIIFDHLGLPDEIVIEEK